jgi:hypothetical protein
MTAPCLPCCEQPVPPLDCSCALLIPPILSPYADYATAETAISDLVVSCMVYHDDPSPFTFASYTAAFTATLDVSWSITPVTGNSCGANGWASVSVAAGSTLDVGYSVANTGVSDADLLCSAAATVYDCEGTQIAIDGTGDVTAPSISGTFSFPITDAGEYWVKFQAQAADDGGSGTATTGMDTDFVISSDDTMVVNPVIAQWDDSGTTRQLEACPKMLLPPQFPPYGTAGDWYVDETEAQAAIDDWAYDCAIYSPDPGVTSATATGDAVAISGDRTLVDASLVSQVYLYSISAENGDSITYSGSSAVSFTGPTPGFTEAQIILEFFEEDGTVIDSAFDSGTTTASISGSFTAPYSGKFYFSLGFSVEAVSVDPGESLTLAGTFSQSGGTAVNPIQALYDVGLTCPARLDC